jgi:branched-chain amino acid transport system substrate-binding protein
MAEDETKDVEGTVNRGTFLKGAIGVGAAGLMVGGVVAACGASDEGGSADGGGGEGGGGEGGGAAAGGDYVIGAVYPLTGAVAADGEQMTNGSDLAVQEINAAGGIAGRMIKREVLDTDITSPEQIQQNYQKLIDQGVDAVINGYLLAWDAAMDIAASYGAPFLNASTSQAQQDQIASDPKYNCIFQIDPSETWYGKGFPKFLNDLEASGAWTPRNKKIFIVEGNVPYSQVISKVTQETAPEYGWEIAGVEPMGAGAISDWTPIMAKVKAADAGVVMNTHYIPSELATFTTAFAADPTDSILYVQYGASVPEYLELAGEAANGVIWATVTGVYGDAIGTAFAERYQAAFSKPAGYSNSGSGYDEVYMLANVWAMLGDSKDFTKVNDMLRKIIWRGVNGGYYMPNNVGQSFPAEEPDMSLSQAHLFFQIQNNENGTIIAPAPFTNGEFQLAPWQSQ